MKYLAYQPGSHRRKVTQELFFFFFSFLVPHLPPKVRAFMFIARRVQLSLSLVDGEVEVCVPTNKSLSV